MSDVIREFLVALGFQVDEASAQKAEAASRRVEATVTAADKRTTGAQSVGAAKRILEANREAGVRTKGAAEHIAGLKRTQEAEKTTTQAVVTESRTRGSAAADLSRGLVSTAQIATSLVVGAAATIASAAIGATTFIERMAVGLERVYYSSQRTKTSAANLRAFGYAAGQLGSSAEEATGFLESLAEKMRSSPGYEAQLNQLGVQTRVNGQMVQGTKLAEELQKTFSKMPYFQQKVFAEHFGMPERVLTALNSGKMRDYMNEYTAMLGQAGLDQEKAAKDSASFMNAWRKMGTAVEVVAIKVQSAIVTRFGASLDKFTTWLLNNSGRISDAFIRIGETILRIVGRVADLFKAFDSLEPGAKSLIIQIGALGLALMLLKAGPLGAILALSAGIVALYDDYKSWKEGSKDTFIDWSKWAPAIESALKSLKALRDQIAEAAKSVTGSDGLTSAFETFAAFLAGAWLLRVLGVFGKFKLGWLAIAALVGKDLLDNATPEGKAKTIAEGETALNREQKGPTGYERGWLGRGWDAVKGGVSRAFGREPAERSPNAGTGIHRRGQRAAAARGEKEGSFAGTGADGSKAPIGGATFRQKAPGVMNRLMEDFNLSKEEAAAVLGNLGHESAGFRAFEEGGNGPGRGWAQWTDPGRKRRFFQYAKDNGLDPKSDDANYGFLKWELQNTHKGSIRDVKQPGTLEEKTERFERTFEGAGVKHYPSRNKYGREALKAYEEAEKAKAASPDTTPSGGDSPKPQTAASPAPGPVLQIPPTFIPKIEGALQNFSERFSGDVGTIDRMKKPFEAAPLGTWSNTSSSSINNVTASPVTNVNISGAGDTKALASEVRNTQSRVHADLLRNVQGAIA